MRIARYDNLKFVLITLVVIGHAIAGMSDGSSSTPATEALYRTIYLFHMPLFVFLSGMFAQSIYSPQNGLKSRRMLGFLAVYVFMLGYYWVIAFASGHQYVFELFSTGGAPWYMAAMFFWTLFIPFVSRYRFRSVALCCISLSFLAGFTPEFGAFLSLGKTVYFAVFFYAGYYCSRERVLHFIERFGGRYHKLGAALLLVAAFSLCLSFPEGAYYEWQIAQGSIPYSALGAVSPGSQLIAGAIRVLSYGPSLILGIALAVLVPGKESRITSWGTRTLQVYALHLLFTNTAYFLNVDQLMLSITPWWPVICIVLSVLLTIVLSAKIFEPPFKWAMGDSRR